MKLRQRKPRLPVSQVSRPDTKRIHQRRSHSTSKDIVEEPHFEEQDILEITLKPTKVRKNPKTIKHTEFQMSRIERGRSQKMFLLSVSRQQDFWRVGTFIWRCQVLGQSQSKYLVTLGLELSCTCPDHYIRKKPCKHIYFMISQVAQFNQLFDKMRNSVTLSASKFQELDQALKKRLEGRIKPKQEVLVQETLAMLQVKLTGETDCVICFEEMDPVSELYQCGQCTKHFHDQCVQAWKRGNHTTCPLCRFQLDEERMGRKRKAEEADVEDLSKDDPLKQLKKISFG